MQSHSRDTPLGSGSRCLIRPRRHVRRGLSRFVPNWGNTNTVHLHGISVTPVWHETRPAVACRMLGGRGSFSALPARRLPVTLRAVFYSVMAPAISSRRSASRPPAFVSPTSAQLVEAVLAGDDAVERHRAVFRAADPTPSMPRLLMQAIDPLLLRAVLGPELAADWVPPLETYYERARRVSPATFIDFDRAWDLERRRWQPVAAADADARPLVPPPDSVEAPRRREGRPPPAPGAAPSRGGRRSGSARGQPALRPPDPAVRRPVAAAAAAPVVEGDVPVPLPAADASPDAGSVAVSADLDTARGPEDPLPASRSP